jgi:4-hydroxy-4-methyl-2-oxoglutarate aldolase
LDVNIPVTVGGIEIRPGDVLHADCNGVTTIPREIVAEVALACQKLMNAENFILHYVTSGTPTAEGLDAAMGACGAAFKAIPAEVRETGG